MKNKIMSKDNKKKFEKHLESMVKNRDHWANMYYTMKRKKNNNRLLFQGMTLIAVMSFCIFFSLTEVISGRGHTSSTLVIAGMGFYGWGVYLLTKVIVNKLVWGAK